LLACCTEVAAILLARMFSPAAANLNETGQMSSWATTTYGDPCRECGYDWSIDLDGAAAIVAAISAQYGELLAGGDGAQRHPNLSWPARAYVAHVADNLRIWAERLVAAALGASARVTPYDENLLATARGYDTLPIEGALWSLARAAVEWNEALRMAAEVDVILVHPDRGEQTVLDVARSNAHDAFHHRWDIERSIQ